MGLLPASYQVTARSAPSFTVAAGPKATDRIKGTKPVINRVNPAAATTVGIFAVINIGERAAAREAPGDESEPSGFTLIFHAAQA